jgi:hypothetical protein
MGTMYSESVAVGNIPTASLALMAELAAAGLPDEVELEWCLWVATTAAMTVAAITRIPTGTPNLIHLLKGFFGFWGVM